MKTLGSLRKARHPAVLAGTAIAAALILAACGGSNDHNFGPVAGGGGGATDPAPIDAFIAAVQGQVSLAAETTGEPINIDALTATAPEDQEPIVI